MKLPFTKSPARRLVPGMLPIALLQEVVRHTEAQWSNAKRRRVLKLLRQSHGRPSNLTARQRRELTSALRELKPFTLAGHLVKTTLTARPAHDKPRHRS